MIVFFLNILAPPNKKVCAHLWLKIITRKMSSLTIENILNCNCTFHMRLLQSLGIRNTNRHLHSLILPQSSLQDTFLCFCVHAFFVEVVFWSKKEGHPFIPFVEHLEFFIQVSREGKTRGRKR